jgi:hypothetical protein
MTTLDKKVKETASYIIPSIKGKRFSGNQVLAFFYSSWALSMPEKVGLLGLPFEKEFEMAKNIN